MIYTLCSGYIYIYIYMPQRYFTHAFVIQPADMKSRCASGFCQFSLSTPRPGGSPGDYNEECNN